MRAALACRTMYEASLVLYSLVVIRGYVSSNEFKRITSDTDIGSQKFIGVMLVDIPARACERLCPRKGHKC